VAEQVRRCTRCPLHDTRIQAVPGEGPVSARVFLVGEAPGRNEDETGRPFCGAAGRNLDLALEAAGLRRDQVFVTSAVKCRPPGNRDPTTLEKVSCRPYLQEQLRLVRPRVMVALGRHGLHGLLGEMPQEFAQMAGSFVAGPEGLPVFVSYHPAAIIYRQKWKPAYLEHWRAFGAWLRSGEPAPLG
jgi:uracil-DNA glycosylase